MQSSGGKMISGAPAPKIMIAYMTYLLQAAKPQLGGKLPLRLNTAVKQLANIYREGNLQGTWTRAQSSQDPKLSLL